MVDGAAGLQTAVAIGPQLGRREGDGDGIDCKKASKERKRREGEGSLTLVSRSGKAKIVGKPKKTSAQQSAVSNIYFEIILLKK